MESYYSLNRFLRNKFGTKVAKLSLDAGFTCPNRDGKISHNGCIFCSAHGSGDFASNRNLSITKQIEDQKMRVSKKWGHVKYIAYFQAFTNTYAPLDQLKALYQEALNCPDVCGIAIATRPDCLNPQVIDLLKELSKKTYVWVELGLQTSKEESAKLINRGYENSVFESAVSSLNQANIDVVVHVILGLPTETNEDMLNTVKYVSSFKIQGIKLQLLHVLKNTPLAQMYEENPFPILTMNEYIDLVYSCVKLIPKNIVIHRLTGDGAKEDLIAPLWSTNKKLVLNSLNAKLNGIN